MKPYVLAALAFVATAFASPTPDVTTLDREPEGPYRNVSLFTIPSAGLVRKLHLLTPLSCSGPPLHRREVFEWPYEERLPQDFDPHRHVHAVSGAAVPQRVSHLRGTESRLRTPL